MLKGRAMGGALTLLSVSWKDSKSSLEGSLSSSWKNFWPMIASQLSSMMRNMVLENVLILLHPIIVYNDRCWEMSSRGGR